MAKNHRVFISHSWDHSTDLEGLRRLLNERGYFNVEFKEVSRFEPINSTNASYVKARLKEKILSSDIVIGLAGMYASHSDWMKWELDTAVSNGVPIIGVIPRGQVRSSTTVTNRSRIDVRWNTESIVSAVRDYSRA
ncbi:TIR domain-containing protein [Vibrio aestuarianus]|uniref:TIR domain-containing protein n=1 Tax=Vibrio aestuarianus TaxID=28171 RepID=A0A9X4EX05_9VIBR|nr:TIR domain-containing protein [Vibrio aestuarianus]MDE1242363.1 TIR domain-containing protein [Vibrio aestuarianus]